MSPLQYLAKELGTSELAKVKSPDRDVLRKWAEEEMVTLGVEVTK